MTAIVDIIGREILDSRGNPTVEVDVVLEDGSLGRAGVPSGASTGAHEAVELRDGDKKRYLGKGVLQGGRCRQRRDLRCAVRHGCARISAASTMRCSKLDGTPNKGRLGANAILGVSLAVAKAAAEAQRAAALSLPRRRQRAPAARADDEHHQRRRACRQPDRHPGIHDHAGGRRHVRGRRPHGRGDLPHPAQGPEGCGPLAPTSATRAASRRTSSRPRRRSTFIMKVDRGSGLQAGRATWCWRSIARPPSSTRAASTQLEGEGKSLDAGGMAKYLAGLVVALPHRVDRGRHGRGRLAGLEGADRALGGKCQLVGDDLFVTNTERLAEGHRPEGIANSILVKVNQIGSLTETLDAVAMAQRAAYTAVISHRSGETEDCHHRRHRGRHQRRPDQDRLAVALRPHRRSTTS